MPVKKELMVSLAQRRRGLRGMEEGGDGWAMGLPGVEDS